MNSYIFHIDMDAFFASVEQADNPELKGKPVIIGHDNRGVVCAASYEARCFGVRSALPTMQARKLCPTGIFLPPRHERYSEVSKEIMDIFRSFSPIVEQASIDEAYLDSSGLEGLFGPPLELGRKIKEAVYDTSGLTCSVGIATVKFLSKIASDLKKPDGLSFIEKGQETIFLKNMPIEKMPGVGPQTLKILHLLGVKTFGQILPVPLEVLAERLGKFGEVIFRRAQGLDDSKVEPISVPKSEGREETLAKDTSNKNILKKYLLEQSEKVSASVRKHGSRGKVITLKIKFADFEQITRSLTLAQPTDSTKLIYNVSSGLLDKLALSKPVRLIGVTLSAFVWNEGKEEGCERALLPGLTAALFVKPHKVQEERQIDTAKERALDTAIDNVRAKFGNVSILRAELLKKD